MRPGREIRRNGPAGGEENRPVFNVTYITSVTRNLPYGPGIRTPCTPIADVTVRMRTMTRFHRLSIVTIGAAPGRGSRPGSGVPTYT